MLNAHSLTHWVYLLIAVVDFCSCMSVCDPIIQNKPSECICHVYNNMWRITTVYVLIFRQSKVQGKTVIWSKIGCEF